MLHTTAHRALAEMQAAAAPQPVATAPPGAANFLTVLGWIFWGGTILCVIAFMIGGLKMMFGSDRGQDNHGQHLGKIAIGALVFFGAANIVNALDG